MIQISTERINSKSPYEVYCATNGDYAFVTNLGRKAVCK